ncbi:hypothetical protein K2O51_22985 [Cupriavidus pinatubonensis]|uniref:hypothetical protein n=1 Tax=Cupriavidus pinatubonensis TaxID=248026 RepID=UPI001C732D56|nr:hypothetical protein [Cupriavidus pinatubonensis]QYY30240.1 hypothetical protein K2O51_22985 [Cupriavidus pinatubonensis]
MSTKKIAAATSLAMLCSVAHAGTFTTRAHGDGIQDVGASISDIVTENFTRAFDSKTYAIVVSYQHHQIGDDNFCAAQVGVSRRPAAKRSVAIPDWRFQTARVERNTGSMSYGQKEACMVAAVRSAVRDLMQADPETIRAKSSESL